MKGSNTAVDVYSWLAIFHGQCATALFNTPLPATLGFLFSSSTSIFSGMCATRREARPRAPVQHPPLSARRRSPPPLHPARSGRSRLGSSDPPHYTPDKIISSSKIQTVPSHGSSFACKLRLCTSPLSPVIA